MSEPKLISPLLDNYVIGEPISEKLGVCCCPALERNSEKKCIVKIISTPALQSQLDALLLSGAYPNADSALQYFKNVAEGIIDEAKVLQRLSQLEGFIPYIGWQLVPMIDAVGFDVYTISEYRTTLSKLLRSDNLTHLSAVNLGLDLCTALAVCRRIGYQYVNLKPENIYLSDNNTWKIGDIGFIHLESLKYASLPERYRSEYTAPEISDAFASLNTTLDVYALGLVLYRIYNANQLPPDLGTAEKGPLPPPDFADYEMSEIILKACDPDPAKRWQDPIEMGQALVSYMQRNDVNDTPIVPTSFTGDIPQVTDSDSESTVETPLISNEQLLSEDPEAPGELIDEIVDENNQATCSATSPTDKTENDSEAISLLLDALEDETAPEHNEDQLESIAVTDEVTRMLSQADDLIASAVPDMTTVAVEESTEIIETIQEPLVSQTDSQLSADTPTDELLLADDASEDEPGVNNADMETGETPPDETTSVQLDTHSDESDEVDEAQHPNDTPVSPDEENLPMDADVDEDDLRETEEGTEEEISVNKSHLIRNLLIGTVLIALAFLAFFFYTKYYLQTIDALSVVNTVDGKATVNISTGADESILSVICSDAYGTPRSSTVENGQAVFENLAPGTAYTIQIEIKGFHRLAGKTSIAFTTPNQMQVIQFNAVTGSDDGSVILSFTTKNQDSEEWAVSYTADDGSQAVENFSGHSHTILGLTVGNTYTFSLKPLEDIPYTGTTEINYTASAVVTPEDLYISGIENSKLTANWSAPDGITVEKWTVHCYGDKGFDKTIVTETTTAVINDVDTAEAYTVEVSAAGMSVTARTSAPANAVSVSGFKAKEDGSKLVISWEPAETAKKTDWLLEYSIDGSKPVEQQCVEPNAVLENRIPGATYRFVLKTSDGVETLGGRMTFRTTDAEKFSGYHVKAQDMRFYLCRTPKKSNWSKKDLSASDYTSTFKPGEKVSILVELNTTYNTSKDSVTTLFVIRNEVGELVNYSTSTRTWTKMWYKGLCELDVPSVPSEPGKYTIAIYMNSMLAGESKITIK